MTDSEALAIVRRHQAWRRGAETEMGDVVQLGLAIDRVIYLADMQVRLLNETDQSTLEDSDDNI